MKMGCVAAAYEGVVKPVVSLPRGVDLCQDGGGFRHSEPDQRHGLDVEVVDV